MLVVEKVFEEITEIISNTLNIPVIGIGAGKNCDGQVLVVNDILGISSEVFQHVHRYLDLNSLIIKAVTEFKNDVENKRFPFEDNLRHLSAQDYQCLMTAMNK